MTIAPSSTRPAIPDPAAGVNTETVIITGKRETDETREIVKEIIDKGPALVEGLTPAELKEFQQIMHDAQLGGGSAAKLVETAEMMNGGAKIMKEILSHDDPEIDPDADLAEGVPVSLGQASDFAKIIGRMMCRAADLKLTEETTADQATLAQATNSRDSREATRNLKQDQELRTRLDLACKP